MTPDHTADKSAEQAFRESLEALVCRVNSLQDPQATAKVRGELENIRKVFESVIARRRAAQSGLEYRYSENFRIGTSS